jgi:hypothetical protein
VDEVSRFACRQNIERYERLLRTYPTDVERAFIERRLAEERRALRSAEITASRAAGGELPKFRPALKMCVAVFLSGLFELFSSNFNLVEQVTLI